MCLKLFIFQNLVLVLEMGKWQFWSILGEYILKELKGLKNKNKSESLKVQMRVKVKQKLKLKYLCNVAAAELSVLIV